MKLNDGDGNQQAADYRSTNGFFATDSDAAQAHFSGKITHRLLFVPVPSALASIKSDRGETGRDWSKHI